VSDVLYEHKGIDKGISRRSIQADIQVMRSNELGYNAPIIVTGKKYYSYADKEYSITNIPLNDQDLTQMNEAVDVLRQFKGFSHFSQLNAVIQKLEDHVYAATHSTRSVIDFEKNEQLKGLTHLDLLYQAIIHQRALAITYQSFNARAASTFSFHPWWLKEFKNRWFVVGIKKKDAPVLSLALDRIHQLKDAFTEPYIANDRYDAGAYYRDVVGVTVSENLRPTRVKIFVDALNAPYVETKPIHHSQQVVERSIKGITITIDVQLNFELEREILSFGSGMVVLAPQALRSRLQKKLINAAEKYEQSDEISTTQTFVQAS
jgi:predicted DNA-binding transcriptional regulator YafY